MAAATVEHSADLRKLPLEELHESPKNPRKHYEPQALQQLADNLKAVGQITPAVVRPTPNGKGGYELAAGHRRLRAAKLAGLTELLAVVRDLDEAQFVEILNIENLQRDDLNALEEAQGFRTLMADAGYDVPKIAERVGRSIKYVYDRLKLLQLIPEAKTLLLDGTITPGHGILLARLSKEDQKRAIEDDDRFRGGGLLEAEDVDGSYFPGDPQLSLDDGPTKARSVRELQQWIDRNVRFVPAKVDQADLAFDLPKTAELLDTAATNKLKVVKITREYRVPDQARDEKERTYGQQGWKRADGEPEPFDRYGSAKDAKPSKTCDHSRVGLVVAGPGRGEAFLVCVNKEKCAVHWAEEMKERAKRAKAREREAAENGNGTGATAKEKKPDPNVLPDDLRRQWQRDELAARVPAILKGVKAVIDELKISDEICWNLLQADVYLDSWNKVGKRGYNNSRGTQHQDELEPLVAAELPGRFGGKTLRAEDGPGARAELAWMIWLARDSGGLDESIDKAVTARWTARRKAETKTRPAQTSAKAKKPAGPQRKRTAKGKVKG
jgi:ParB/RepB/Spo0J family partition protein